MTRLPLARTLLPLSAALALTACGEAEEPAYEADATDVGGGELIVNDAATPGAAQVDVPDTPMTPVPEGATPTGEPIAEDAPPPAE